MEPSRNSELLRQLFGEAWREKIAVDEQEPDLELLAAYVDGRLDEVGVARLAQEIQKSPLPWQLLEQSLHPDHPLPTPLAAAQIADNPAPQITPKSSTASTKVISRLQLAVAASILLAVTATVLTWQSEKGRAQQAIRNTNLVRQLVQR